MPARPALRSLIADVGALGSPNADGVRVADGFTARILAIAGEEVPGTSYVWHTYPDGGTCFATTDGGWIYVSNSEVPVRGGVSALRFDASGALTGAYRILAILPDGTLRALVQIDGQDDSEITGPAFDPSGTRLYFSSQRGGTRSLGITYVIEGPFHEPA